jgi:thiol-disulfide isomerase/thioredoxin
MLKNTGMKFVVSFIVMAMQVVSQAQQPVIFNMRLKNADSAGLVIGTIEDGITEKSEILADLMFTSPVNHLTVPLKAAADVYILGQHFYLEPGNEYDIQYDAGNNSVEVGGKSEGNYLCWKLLSKDSITVGSYSMYKGNEMLLEQKLAANWNRKGRILDSLRKTGLISQNCYQFVYDETFYRYLSTTRRIISSLGLSPYDSIARRLLLNYNDSLYTDAGKMRSKFYRGSLYEYTTYILAGNWERQYNEAQFKKIREVIQHKFTGLQKEYLLTYSFYEYLHQDIPGIYTLMESWFPEIRQQLSSARYIRFLDSVYTYYGKVNRPVQKEIAGIKLYDKKDKTTLFSNIIDQAGDKDLLIEFWASWCSPCLSQIKRYNEKKTSLNSSTTEIIFISIDKDPVSFIKAADKLEIQSYIIKDSAVDLFGKYYSLGPIPRTILIKNKMIKQLNIDLDGFLGK